MKREIVLIALVLLISVGRVFGFEKPAEHMLTAQIWYPLSTNTGKDDISNINLYLAYSRLGAVRGIDAGYGFSHVSGDVRGLQWSYFGSYVGGELTGVASTGLFSGVRGHVLGIQLTSLGNWAGAGLSGVQAAGIANVSVGPTDGAQFAGVTNVARGAVRGFQGAGIVNIAGDVTGVQTAGIVNVAHEVRGVQIGLVNVAEKMKGVPVGLVNVSRNGGVQISGWYGGVTDANAGLRFRSGAFYTLFTYGYTSGTYDGISHSFEKTTTVAGSFAVGTQIPFGPFRLNFDAGVVAVDNGKLYAHDKDEDQWGLQYRGAAELPLFCGLSAFAGLGATYLVDADTDMGAREFGRGAWNDFVFFGGGYEL